MKAAVSRVLRLLREMSPTYQSFLNTKTLTSCEEEEVVEDSGRSVLGTINKINKITWWSPHYWLDGSRHDRQDN